MFFTGIPGLTDRALTKICLLPNLHTLLLFDIRNVQGTGLSSMKGPKFRRLEVVSCRSVLNEGLCDVLKNCPNLEWLSICWNRWIDERVVNTAFDVTENRNNGVSLKLIGHAELIRTARRCITPPSLELLINNNHRFYEYMNTAQMTCNSLLDN